MVKNLISKRLRRLREEKGLFQKDIAKLLNISTSAYGYYEQGKRSLDIHMLRTLCKFYGVSSDWIIGITDNKNPYNDIVDKKVSKIIEDLGPDIILQLCDLKDMTQEEKDNLMVFLEGLKARRQVKSKKRF